MAASRLEQTCKLVTYSMSFTPEQSKGKPECLGETWSAA
jgi:hypothetical protein